MRVHCEKTSLYTTFWLTWMCAHENVLIEARVSIQVVTQFPMLCSSDMFPRSVSTTRRIHARVHTLKDRCLYTFWLTKSCLCVTLNISHLVCHIISHRWSRNKVQHHNGDKTQLVLLKQIIGNFSQNMRNAHINVSGDILKKTINICVDCWWITLILHKSIHHFTGRSFAEEHLKCSICDVIVTNSKFARDAPHAVV